MANENKIYEITQMISDNQVIQGDVNHAAGMIRAMLSEKYISPITRAINAENKRVRKNPCREARLLDALKPFTNQQNQQTLEKAIDTLHMLETMRGLSKQMPNNNHSYNSNLFQPLAAANIQGHNQVTADNSYKEDGIYDIDEKCMGHQSQIPLMPIILIMSLMNSSMR